MRNFIFGFILLFAACSTENLGEFPKFEPVPAYCDHFELVDIIFDGRVVVEGIYMTRTTPAKIFELHGDYYLVQWKGEEACVYVEKS